MEESVKERLIAYLKYKDIGQKAFALSIGKSAGYVNAIRKSIQPDTINSIAMQYPDLNTGWLLTGEGEMLKDSPEGNAIITDPYGMEVMRVPVVPIGAHAGLLNGYGDNEYIDSLPTMDIQVDTHYKGSYLIFTVTGDSLYNGSADSLMDGDRVLARSVHFDYWRNKLYVHKWKYWVFVMKEDGIIIKMIKEQNLETGELILQSLNPMYEDIHININDVAGIYNVVRLVERKF